MGIKGIDYHRKVGDLYAEWNIIHASLPVHDSGLSGMWAVQQEEGVIDDLSNRKWGEEREVGEYEGLSSEIVGARTFDLLSYWQESGYSLKGKTVVDIGSGDGNLSRAAHMVGAANVYGIDPSGHQRKLFNAALDGDELGKSSRLLRGKLEEAGLVVARDAIDRNALLAITGYGEGLTTHLKEGSADVALMKFSLQWGDAEGMLKEAYKLLKPGGDLWIMTTTAVAEKPNLFCRAWNKWVEGLKCEKYKFKHDFDPKNPNPVHVLEFLEHFLGGIGFEYGEKKVYAEVTAENPEGYLDFLMPIVSTNLERYLERRQVGFSSKASVDAAEIRRQTLHVMSVMGREEGDSRVIEEQVILRVRRPDPVTDLKHANRKAMLGYIERSYGGFFDPQVLSMSKRGLMYIPKKGNDKN